MKLLKFINVTFGYKKGKPVFKDLTFEVSQPIGKGFVVGMMGSSGSGKSTLLKLILGIEKVFDGYIEILPSNPVVSYVPQEPVLFEHLSTKQNAEYFKSIGSFKSKFRQELFDEVASVLQINNLFDEESSISKLSGGQKQRIALLRALSIQPDILLLDEPLTGLDEEIKDQFLQTLIQLIQRFSLFVIYVTHHSKEAEFVSDVIAYLDKEPGTGNVTSVRIVFAKEFFSTPPTVSALNAIKELHINTMQFILSDDNVVLPLEPTIINPSAYLMSFQEAVLHFSNNVGFEYEVAAKTGLYTVLRLVNSQVVFTIDNETFSKFENLKLKYILLCGEIDVYSAKGQYIQKTEIQDNKIINWQDNE